LKIKSGPKFWIGIAVSSFFLVILLMKTDFILISETIKSMDLSYLFLAVLFTFASYFLRAVRWKYLLVKEKKISLSSLYQATVIGYMANNLLPARMGELVRAYALSSKEKLQFLPLLASLVMDRLSDGFSVLVMLVLTLFIMEFPPRMQEAENALKTGGVLIFLFYAAVIVFILLLKSGSLRNSSLLERIIRRLPLKFSLKIKVFMDSFAAGVALPAKFSDVLAILAASAFIWFFCILPVDMILESFSIKLPFYASMFIMVLLVFAVMVPASPGYIGTYHYACFKGLSVFGVPDSKAIGVALVIHAVGFFPVIIAGFYYLFKNGMSLNKMSSEF